MYEARHMQASGATRRVAARTGHAYEAGAAEYAEATRNFDEYPGLRAALIEFADTMPATLPALDLGCGGGRDTRLLTTKGKSVIAGDISMAMLRAARRQTDFDSLRAATYIRLNMLELPFQDDQFGGIWASGSLLHLPSADLPQALSEIWRTLAPGGVTALSMRSGTGEGWRNGGTLPGCRWFTLVRPQDFAEQLAQHDFGQVGTRYIGRQDWFIAWGRKP
jgi:ubiquinone/menaquinone biosynthesis C-methylase UbiE